MRNDSTSRGDGFPSDFVWGASTASYQIEGSTHADGRSESIWDVFSRKPGAVIGGMTGDLACDSYRRWKEDVELLRGLGVGAYRFSLAWPRILPEGSGRPNRAGIDHYRRLVEALLAAGIEPWACLYHWDLPQLLEDAGGWPARDTALRFADYAALCYRELGDLVGSWHSLNEPWCSAFLGYDRGEHAPGIRDKVLAYRAVHHLLLGHGLAVRAFRASPPKGASGRAAAIGISLNPAKPRPATFRPADILAAQRASEERTGLFMDPLFGRGYPERHIAAHRGVTMPILDGDLEIIASPIDFLGINYYNEDVVGDAPVSAERPEGFVQLPSWQAKTDIGWPVVPRGLFRLLSFLDEGWSPKSMYVTENGAAFPEEPDASGRVADGSRIEYLRGHIAACGDAVAAGIPLRGYFVWSLLDNFEWAWGYSKRFGIVHVDYRTLERRPKDSYWWYRDVVAGHGPC